MTPFQRHLTQTTSNIALHHELERQAARNTIRGDDEYPDPYMIHPKLDAGLPPQSEAIIRWRYSYTASWQRHLFENWDRDRGVALKPAKRSPS